MGAGAILTEGSTLDPILQISVPVGGPLASVRPEAVALLCLLQQIREKMDVPGRLTVFIDCLCLLQFLSKWGRANYWPGLGELSLDIGLGELSLDSACSAALVRTKHCHIF
jgi:hypothetical protein